MNERGGGNELENRRGKSGWCQNDPPPPAVDYGETTNPGDITHPVWDLIAPALKDAWEINTAHRMSLIFNPVRQFEWGVPYDDNAVPKDAFAKYDPDPK